MHIKSLLALAASASATIQGFNYGSTNPDGSFASQQDFQNQFAAARKLAGTNGAFNSARLYTMIQGGTTSNPTGAIPAAIATKTRILLGMWASSGSATMTNEINALKAAMEKYGSAFTSLVDGISVGSEDLYRVTPTSQMNTPGGSVGASPDELVSYIKEVRSAIAGTALSGAHIGHVDTWTAWVNGSNSAVVDACDWIGMDAYPYFQATMANSIKNGKSLFDDAWSQTKSFAKGKAVWITETGWPLSGKQSNQATPSTENAQQYWEAVGCGELFGKVNTYWFTYYDGTPSPSFGLVSSVGGQPKFDLSCSKKATITGGTASTIGGGVAEATHGASSTGTGSASYPTGSSNSSSPSSGSPGVPPSPSGASTTGSSGSPATAGASSNAVSFFGIVGAALAALAVF